MWRKLCGHFDYTDTHSFGKNLLYRLWVWWCLKAVGSMSFITLFFVLYFYLLTHHYFYVTVIPATVMDEWISFNGSWLYFYLSLWVYVSLPPALTKSKKELLQYGVYAAILSLIGIFFYIFFPTTIQQNSADWGGSADMIWLKSMDMGGNAFPSMHVASAFFSFIWLNYQLKQMRGGKILYALSFLWCCAIIYSTLAVKQHLFIDVIGGLILGGSVALVTLRYHTKTF
ncbi:MAG: phosphatase PAP2 family protein [Sulfuricurvum sp.]|uniref:phosphatase PAP2 family protein n=1 Tax=Sulfuricurvum sp. TaxID=2025608 RepID=UPI002628714D|nr:phosphatase PAP2 family protein [Sulfuricurvum sp.]MDD2828032.1 phosphatase PAP2 family protein [Sulfuricurvum sp.]MDD4948091.1 phosphatase PAP2 family protein [Sulfuricurvum sp.]